MNFRYDKYYKKWVIKISKDYEEKTSYNYWEEHVKYVVDFDLSIIGTEYVDFIDAVIKRYYSVSDIVENYDDLKKKFTNYINTYDAINSYVKLDIKGSISMSVLKLIAVHLYLLLNKQNINIFIQNNHNI